jgi:hypothetical protein
LASRLRSRCPPRRDRGVEAVSHEAWKSALALASGDRVLAGRLVERSARDVLLRLVLKHLSMSEDEFWRMVAREVEEP